MFLHLAAFLGGALTLASPCILPVLPFVLARSDQPFWRGRLPMLAGMAATFAGAATLTTVGAHWVIHLNEIGRTLALLVLALLGATLVWPALADLLARPGLLLGNALAAHGQRRGHGIAASLLLGVATGLLWTPCAGPVLGLVLSAAAWHGPSVHTSSLLLAYAAGAASMLGLVMAGGARLMSALRPRLTLTHWLRRALGVAVLGGVASLAIGATLPLTAPAPGTTQLENRLLDLLAPARADAPPAMLAATGPAAAGGAQKHPYRSTLPVEGSLPELEGAVQWLNSPPLSSAQLRGKVVLVDFWTYSCINCIRTLPYVRAWAEKYRDQGLVVIGVHTPEFAFERKVDNVRQAAAEFKLGFPIAVDSDFRLWRAFDNQYWPALYLADAQGKLRYHQFGEGRYEATEEAIAALLKEAGSAVAEPGPVAAQAPGIEAAPDLAQLDSPETYLGYRQGTGPASPERVAPDRWQHYSGAPLQRNQWSLDGQWRVGAEAVTLKDAGGSIRYRFSARDLHLVLGPAEDGRPVRFEVSIDGQPPGELRGADIDAAGRGSVERTRLFQLVRQRGEVKPRLFEVRFLDPGANAYVFTFG